MKNPFDIFGTQKKLDTIISKLIAIEGKEDKMALDLTALNQAMDAMGVAIQDAIAEIEKLAAGLGNTVDPAVIQSITDKLNAGAASLEAAKTAAG